MATKIRIVSTSDRPTARDAKVYLDDKDITDSVRALRFSMGVGVATIVSIDFVATVELDAAAVVEAKTWQPDEL